MNQFFWQFVIVLGTSKNLFLDGEACFRIIIVLDAY